MKKIACLFVCLFAMSANATVIDFSTLAPGTEVTNISGVRFKLIGNADSGNAVADGSGLANSSSVFAYPTAHILSASFNGLVDNLTFDFNEYGYLATTLWTTFDVVGSILETGSLSTGFFSTTLDGISQIQWTNGKTGTDNWYFSVNNLSYDEAASVPEPASIVLLGLGLAGIGFSRKNKNV